MLLRYFVSTLFGNLTRCLQRTESNRTKMASKYTPDNRLKADLRKNADNLLTKSDKEKSQTTNYQLFAILKARSEANAINLNRILPILILSYLHINILHPFFINCEVWKFSKIRPMYDKNDYICNRQNLLTYGILLLPHPLDPEKQTGQNPNSLHSWPW